MLSHLALSLLALTIAAQDPSAGEADVPPSGDAAKQAVAETPRHGEWVDIEFEGSPIKTFVAYPERGDEAPVVIVIHEIYGMSDWIKGVADQLAAEGYVAVAPDLLSGMGPDGGGTDSIENVREEIRKLKPEMVTERLNAVGQWARDQPSTTDKVGVIGFCLGGSQSFNYAAMGGDHLDAAVVYYGTAPSDAEQIAKVGVPVLGLYGGDDARVTSTVEPTTAAMDEAGKNYETHVYEGAGHGFLRQQDGRDGANMKAAREAWKATLDFFKTHLSEN